jgi:hypothetical protein
MFCAGAAIYHYLDQGRNRSAGPIVLGLIGLMFVGLGIFTGPKTGERIAESIDF